MKMKKLLALLMAMIMVLAVTACGGGKTGDDTKATDAAGTAATGGDEPAAGASADKPDWTEYDALIKEIKAATDMKERVALMHKAEDMLMDTGAIIPLYYYNDEYMMDDALTGFWATNGGGKYFMYSEIPGKDTLRLNIASEPDRLDPALNSSVDGSILAANSFAGLCTTNENNEIVPNLAESVEHNEDYTEFTVKLRPDLKWSNGDKLDANDFVWSWKRAADAETGADYKYMFDCIEGYPDNLAVEASEDGSTLTIKLAAPTPYFPELLSFTCYLPVHQASVEGAEGYKDADGKILDAGAWALEAGFVSNGAYTLEEWKHNESMTYVKNPNFFRADDVKFEKLVFTLTADNTVALQAFLNGDLDFIDAVPADERENMQKDPRFHVVDNLGTYYVCFNVNNQELFGDLTWEQACNLRKAIGHLIDRQYIIDSVAQNKQVLATSFIPEGMADGNGGIFRANTADYKFPYEEDLGYYPAEPDVDKALELLEAAGFEVENGKLVTPISFEYLTNESDSHEKVAQLIQDDLKAVGIEMQIKTQSWDNFLSERKAGNFGVARNGWVADFNDPINMLEMWTTDSGNNDCQLGK